MVGNGCGYNFKTYNDRCVSFQIPQFIFTLLLIKRFKSRERFTNKKRELNVTRGWDWRVSFCVVWGLHVNPTGHWGCRIATRRSNRCRPPHAPASTNVRRAHYALRILCHMELLCSVLLSHVFCLLQTRRD